MRVELAVVALLMATSAFADQDPDFTRVNNRCNSWALCKQQSATGICVSHRNGDELVLDVGKFAHYTFYSVESTASSYSCDIYTNTDGYDASVADSTATDQVNTTSITDEAPVYTMQVLLQKLWINCTEVADNVVNIDVVVCVEN